MSSEKTYNVKCSFERYYSFSMFGKNAIKANENDVVRVPHTHKSLTTLLLLTFPIRRTVYRFGGFNLDAIGALVSFLIKLSYCCLVHHLYQRELKLVEDQRLFIESSMVKSREQQSALKY